MPTPSTGSKADGGTRGLDCAPRGGHQPTIRGAGVSVAIIDLGFAGYAVRQASGDLPYTVITQDYCGGYFATPPSLGGTSHGTAVAEIVYKMAPRAQLYLLCRRTISRSSITRLAGSADEVAVAEGDLSGIGAAVYNAESGEYDALVTLVTDEGTVTAAFASVGIVLSTPDRVDE
jgi:hypothetical protein